MRLQFWLTGILYYCIAPIADNLTTAMRMCFAVMVVGVNKPVFIATACKNIVLVAIAGGAFSSFGGVATQMVWQKRKLGSFEFFHFFTICGHFY
ncbi:MAG: sodium:proton antiporter NhaD [Rhodobacterales bacterium]